MGYPKRPTRTCSHNFDFGLWYQFLGRGTRFLRSFDLLSKEKTSPPFRLEDLDFLRENEKMKHGVSFEDR